MVTEPKPSFQEWMHSLSNEDLAQMRAKLAESAGNTNQAYKCGIWHDKCSGVQLISDGGGFLYLWCPECRCTTNMEAVAKRCTYEESREVGR